MPTCSSWSNLYSCDQTASKNQGVNKKETSNPYNKATVDYINDLASYHVYGDDKGYYLDYDSMIESDFYQGLKSEKPFEITKEQYQKILSIDYDKSEAIKEGRIPLNLSLLQIRMASKSVMPKVMRSLPNSCTPMLTIT